MERELLDSDRDKLRAALRKLGPQYVFYMMDAAIDALPPSKLLKIAGKYIDLKRLRLGENTAKISLLEEVTKFDKASRASEYYESFNVNSKNCTKQSTGTTAWMAIFSRLLERCADEAAKGDPVEICTTFNILFGLLDRIDECYDDIIFFADEGGAWQVSVDWDEVLPPWFKVLSTTAAPGDYAERICALLHHHYNYGSEKMLAIADNTATPQQRVALADVVSRQKSKNRGGLKP